MTLTRVTGKVFAENAQAEVGGIGQFGSAKTGTPNPTTDVATIQGLAAYGNGWGSAIITDKNFPPMEEVNGVLKTISYQACYLLQEGIPSYDSGTTYSNTSIVKSFSGANKVLFYRSIVDNNTGNSLSDTDYWQKVNFEYDPLSIDGQWVYKKLLITTSTTATQTPYEFDLHTYLGVASDNTVQYELLFAQCYYADTSSVRKGIIYSDVISDYFIGSANSGYGSMATTDQGRTTGYIGIIPVKTKLYMDLKGKFTTNELIAIGYRRLGTNQ